MRHALILVLTALLVCTGCGNGGPAALSAAQLPTNLEGNWVWKIGFGCALLPGFLDPNDGDEIFFVTQNGLRLSADFFDAANNRVVMDATIDGACVQGTYTITEPDLRLLTGQQSICDNKAYTSSGTPVLAADFGQVQVIDLLTNQETSTINFGTPPGRLCGTPDGEFVFVPLPLNGSVAVIDTSTDTVVDTITGDAGEMPAPFCCVATNDTLYVGNDLQVDSGGVITVIDIASGSVVNTVFTTGFEATDIVLNSTATELFVAFSDNNQIESFLTATLASNSTIPLPFEPNSMDITPNDQQLVVVGDTQTMVCSVLTGDDISVVDMGGHDVRVTPDGSKFWLTHLPNEGSELQGITMQYRTISGYNLSPVTHFRTYWSNSNIPAFGIDLCGDGDYALTGFSSQRATAAWDLRSTNQFGSQVGSYSPAEFVYISPRRLIIVPPPRVIVLGFKFFTAFNPITGNAMLDGDLGVQSDSDQILSGTSCTTDSWTEVIQER